MSQIDFLFCEQERVEFVQFAFKQKCMAIPDMHYNRPTYYSASNLEEYNAYCKDSPLLFLLNEAYSIHPLELSSFEKDNATNYFIQQRHGGPSVDFYSPVIGEKENKVVGPGFLGIYPYYYHNTIKFEIGAEIKNIYKVLGDFIKSRSTKVQMAKRTFWLGEETIEKANNKEFNLLPISGVNVLDLVK